VTRGVARKIGFGFNNATGNDAIWSLANQITSQQRSCQRSGVLGKRADIETTQFGNRFVDYASALSSLGRDVQGDFGAGTLRQIAFGRFDNVEFSELIQHAA
jgi:hypothetical protein